MATMRRAIFTITGVALYFGVVFGLAFGSFLWSLRGGIDEPIIVHTADQLTEPPVQVAPARSFNQSPELPAPATAAPVPDQDPNIFFVSPNLGDENNDGQTADSPWQSLHNAIWKLQPGQTLLLMDGEYAEQAAPDYAHYQVSVNGTPDAWIRIGAAPGHQPVLTPSSGNAIEVQGAYIELSGLTIRGHSYNEENSYGWGVIIRDTHHVRIQEMTISNMPVGGISGVGSSNIEIYRNEVFENSFWGTEQGSGISLWSSKNHGYGPSEDGYHDKIIGNIAYRNENKVYSRWSPNRKIKTDGNGIIIDETNENHYKGKFLIANNVLFDNGGRAVITNLAANIDIVYNTTYGNGRTPDLAGGAVEIAAVRSQNVRILNNIAWALPNLPALAVKEMSGLTIGGNVFVTDKPTGHETGDDIVTPGPIGLRAPNIDPTVADFRPTADSVVIDRALAAAVTLGFDADGNPRTGTGADIGAYEYTP